MGTSLCFGTSTSPSDACHLPTSGDSFLAACDFAAPYDMRTAWGDTPTALRKWCRDSPLAKEIFMMEACRAQGRRVISALAA